MRVLTAGESHGPYIIALIEGFPKGVKIKEEFINGELHRRMSGFGRGARMSIEEDKVEFIAGLRNAYTLGSPIAMLVKNKDVKIPALAEDDLAELLVPRPAHADLAGALKYGERDIRNILERASARETAARVCIGAVCKQFLSNFKVQTASFTVSVGKIVSTKKAGSISEILAKTKKSELNCIDSAKEKLMLKEIERAKLRGDSLGGVVEIWIEGVCPGIGSFMEFDRRLDAKLASYLMSIPGVKGVEFGLGFEYAQKNGSCSHDKIYYDKKKLFHRNTNNSGGIEGGISNGSAIVVRLAMKPIATLGTPLDSVNLITKKKELAIVERSDTCVVVALSVIAESMCTIAITEEYLVKFGCDTLGEIKANYQNYLRSLQNF